MSNASMRTLSDATEETGRPTTPPPPATPRSVMASSATTTTTTTTLEPTVPLKPASSMTVTSAPPAVDLDSDAMMRWPPEKIEVLATAIRSAPWHRGRYHGQTFERVMTGDEITEWLRRNNYGVNKIELEDLGAAMVHRGLLFRLNRRTEKQLFHDSKAYQYTPEKVEHSNFLMAAKRLVAAVKSQRHEIRLRTEGLFVYVEVEEFQRRVDSESPFSMEHLLAIDPTPPATPPFDSIVVPAVGRSTPDECEWVTDAFTTVVSSATDAEGWTYSKSFFEPFVAQVGSESLVRRRTWQRPAKEKRKDFTEVTGERAPVAPSNPDGDFDLMEDIGRLVPGVSGVALVNESLRGRLPRKGALELIIHNGVNLVRNCDSYVIIKHRTMQMSTDLCPATSLHQWNATRMFAVEQDVHDTVLVVMQKRILKDACLGETSFTIPENETSGSVELILHPASGEKDPLILAARDHLGYICVTWSFAVERVETSEEVVEVDVFNSTTTIQLKVARASGVARQRKTYGPCQMPGVQSAASAFIVVEYMGGLCEMKRRSPTRPAATSIEFDWTTFLDVVPRYPLRVSLWFSDFPVAIGSTTLSCIGPMGVGTFRLQPDERSAATHAGELLIQWKVVASTHREEIVAQIESTEGNLLARW